MNKKMMKNFIKRVQIVNNWKDITKQEIYLELFNIYYNEKIGLFITILNFQLRIFK